MNILYITTHFLAISQTADYSVTMLHHFVLKDLLYFAVFFFFFVCLLFLFVCVCFFFFFVLFLFFVVFFYVLFVSLF